MSSSALPPDIRQLPVPERMALIEQIWDSVVEDEADFSLTDAQKAELDRRLARRRAITEGIAQMDAGEGIPIEEAFQEIRKRLGLPNQSQ